MALNFEWVEGSIDNLTSCQWRWFAWENYFIFRFQHTDALLWNIFHNEIIAAPFLMLLIALFTNI